MSCSDLSSPPPQARNHFSFTSVSMGWNRDEAHAEATKKDWLNSFPTSTFLTVCMGADFQAA